MTPRQLEILQHALGVDGHGRGRLYRNHFCAGGRDEGTCRELIAMGYMTQVPTSELFPYFNCTVTEAGKAAVRTESPKPPKLTRSQERYRRWLDVADTGISFGDWLKSSARESRNAQQCRG